MNLFKAIIISFCTVSLLLGAIYIICPDSHMNKPVKYVLSLVFLLTIISVSAFSVKKANIDFEIPKYNSEENDDMMVTAAEYVYGHILKESNINYRKITVCTNKSDNDSIIISKVIIYSDCEKQRIIDALSVIADNYEVEVINE